MSNYLKELNTAKHRGVPLINIVTPDQRATAQGIVEMFDAPNIKGGEEHPRPLCPVVSWDLINNFEGMNTLGKLAIIFLAAKLGNKASETEVKTAAGKLDTKGKSKKQQDEDLKEFTGLYEAARKVIKNVTLQTKMPPTDCVVNAQMFPEDTVVIALNFHQYLKPNVQTMPATSQALVNLRDQFKVEVKWWSLSMDGWSTGTRTFIALSSETIQMPSELQQDFLFLDEPLPTDEERKKIIVDIHTESELEVPDEKTLTEAVDATRSMSRFSTEQETALSFTPTGIDVRRLEQRSIRLINNQPGMRVWDGDESFADVGGNRNLITYIKTLVENNPPGLVQFCDEFEKAFSGSAIGSAGLTGDSSGTSQGMLGEYLKWYVDKGAYGILIVGPGGTGKCFQKGTKIMMFDGTSKSIEDIEIGDQVMGDDSTSRNVLSLTTGRDKMYKITPTKGDPFTVNGAHILCLKQYNAGRCNTLEVSVDDYLKTGANWRKYWMLYRNPVEFSKSEPLDEVITPYFLGLWLGDGTSMSQDITTPDEEVVEYLTAYGSSLGFSKLTKKTKLDNKASTYAITNGCTGKNNILLDALRRLGVSGNKHIPHAYKTASRTQRLELLAGLLDSDGYYDTKNKYFEITSKYEALANDIVFVARSLGLAAYINSSEKFCQTGGGGMYHRVSLSGDFCEIPTKVKRKQAEPRLQIKHVDVTGLKIEPVGEDDYFGFMLDGNHKFLLADFTVSHNSLISKATGTYAGVKTVSFNMKAMQSPYVGASTKNLLDNLKIIDSFSPRYPLVIATTNDPELLPPELKSRFDVTFYTPMPKSDELALIWEIQKRLQQIKPEQAAPLPDDFGWVGRDIFKCCRKANFMRIPLVGAAKYISPARISAAKSIAYLNFIAAENGYINASEEGPYKHIKVEEYEEKFAMELSSKTRKINPKAIN